MTSEDFATTRGVMDSDMDLALSEQSDPPQATLSMLYQRANIIIKDVSSHDLKAGRFSQLPV